MGKKQNATTKARHESLAPWIRVGSLWWSCPYFVTGARGAESSRWVGC